jgi:hypothetical protein
VETVPLEAFDLLKLKQNIIRFILCSEWFAGARDLYTSVQKRDKNQNPHPQEKEAEFILALAFRQKFMLLVKGGKF